MDVNGVADAGREHDDAGKRKVVAKVCFDPDTLEVSSATRVALSRDEIQRIESDFRLRTGRGTRDQTTRRSEASIVRLGPEAAVRIDFSGKTPPEPILPGQVQVKKGTEGKQGKK
jgi:hypothetical protein